MILMRDKKIETYSLALSGMTCNVKQEFYKLASDINLVGDHISDSRFV